MPRFIWRGLSTRSPWRGRPDCALSRTRQGWPKQKYVHASQVLWQHLIETWCENPDPQIWSRSSKPRQDLINWPGSWILVGCVFFLLVAFWRWANMICSSHCLIIGNVFFCLFVMPEETENREKSRSYTRSQSSSWKFWLLKCRRDWWSVFNVRSWEMGTQLFAKRSSTLLPLFPCLFVYIWSWDIDIVLQNGYSMTSSLARGTRVQDEEATDERSKATGESLSWSAILLVRAWLYIRNVWQS